MKNLKAVLQKNRRLFAVCIVVFALPVCSRLVVRSVKAQNEAATAAAVRYSAFTLSLVEVQRKGAGVASRPTKTSRLVTIAQRSDGTTSKTITVHPQQPYEHTYREIRLPNMQKVTAFDAVGMKIVGVPAADALITRVRVMRPNPATGCELTYGGQPALPIYQRVGKEVVGGLETIKFAHDNPHVEAWHSPALDCETVRSIIEFPDRQNATVIDETVELVMTKYSLGEPAPELFAASNLRPAAATEAWPAVWRQAGFPESYVQEGLGHLRGTSQQHH